jgi:hypothetical protein
MGTSAVGRWRRAQAKKVADSGVRARARQGCARHWVFRTVGLKRQLRDLRSGAGAGGGSTASSVRRLQSDLLRLPPLRSRADLLRVGVSKTRPPAGASASQRAAPGQCGGTTRPPRSTTGVHAAAAGSDVYGYRKVGPPEHSARRSRLGAARWRRTGRGARGDACLRKRSSKWC